MKVKVFSKTYSVAASTTKMVEYLTNTILGIPTDATIDGIIASAQTGEPNMYMASVINRNLYVRNGWAGGTSDIPIMVIAIYYE